MTNLSAIRDRYLRDELPVRLGGLAANLARVKSFSDNPEHREAVAELLEESKHFIEWTAVDAELEVQVRLVELQRQLARWGLHWNTLWGDPQQRATVAEQAQAWSRDLLKLAGLLVARSNAGIRRSSAPHSSYKGHRPREA